MPTKSIVGIRQNKLSSLRPYSYAKSTIKDIQARIANVLGIPSNKFKSIKSVKYGKINVQRVHYAIIQPSEVLPFRVRFTTINVKPYDINNPAPIGIAVIGINNYIL